MPFFVDSFKTSICIRYKINHSNNFEYYCLKLTTLSLFKANRLKQPTFREAAHTVLITKSQIQRHFDVGTIRFAKLFVKAGWHVLSLFIPKRIDKLFLDVVSSKLLKLRPFQANKN